MKLDNIEKSAIFLCVFALIMLFAQIIRSQVF